MADFCQLCLTCKDKSEADKIADALLVKHLIACARQMPVSSTYRWKGKIETSNEVMLLMESRSDLFEEIEKEVAKIHSYDTFVLESFRIEKLSGEAKGWLKEVVRHG